MRRQLVWTVGVTVVSLVVSQLVPTLVFVVGYMMLLVVAARNAINSSNRSLQWQVRGLVVGSTAVYCLLFAHHVFTIVA